MRDDLERVETELQGSVVTDDPFLTEVAGHLIKAGGKRQRPAFAIAAAATAAQQVGAATEDVVMGGVAVELVHLGSLYHDDVMDDAATRRAVDSVNARWGNLTAILAGDFLLARASEIAAGLGTEVAALLANTIGRLCEGQIRELKDIYNRDRTEADYLASIQGKTAALFATACRVGGIVGGLPRDHIESLTNFGRAYGMAFQVVDDILDLVWSTEQLGKPSGNDLVEGVYTLPTILAIHADVGPALSEILGAPLDPDQREDARTLIRSTGVIDASIAVAEQYTNDALALLEPLGSSAAADGLAATARQLLAQVRSAA